MAPIFQLSFLPLPSEHGPCVGHLDEVRATLHVKLTQHESGAFRSGTNKTGEAGKQQNHFVLVNTQQDEILKVILKDRLNDRHDCNIMNRMIIYKCTVNQF